MSTTDATTAIPTASIETDVKLDVSDLKDVLEMIGPTCPKCEAAYEFDAYLTRGSRGRRLSTKVTASCPECGYEHDVMTGVVVSADFELGVETGDV